VLKDYIAGMLKSCQRRK